MTGATDIEWRPTPSEVRAKGRRVEGYVATFGSVADLGGGLTETIQPGAFREALQNQGDILALMDHDMSSVLGRTRSGSLTLKEDEKGLAFSLELPNTQAGNDALALAERGDLGGMSFGFHVPKGGDTWEGTKRTLNKVDLREVSIVSAIPAYPDTTIALRHYRHIADSQTRLRVLVLAEMEHWGS
ncbi:MAG: HK97 family phage prohead protease [Alphaproteobacteria bacterium]|nr:HK97 family phage prohead protease [Alphaproteobacteria bacterium]